MKIPAVLSFSLAVWIAGTASADVKLPAIFSDHMVLARTGKVPVWGKADPGEEVSVVLAGHAAKAKTGPDGKWMLDLDLKDSAQGPFEMTVQGKNKIQISDVVVGEVWLGGGQSNMELPLKRLVKSPDEVTHSENPMLRQYEVRKKPSADAPVEDCEGFWAVAGPGTTAEFGSLGYYFGKALQKELRVPVGIIKDCWGGTAVEPWISAGSIATVPDLQNDAQARHQLSTNSKAALAAWLKKTNREDHPATDITAFTTGPVSEADGWSPVKTAGEVSAPGLPKYGAFWFRKEVTLPPVQLHVPQVLELAVGCDFDRVYWNGTFLGETTFNNNTGATTVRRYYIPAALIKEGKNDLAVRMFAPAVPPAFSWPPQIGTTILAGPWQAKAEFALPPLEKGTPPAPKIIPQHAVAGSLFNGMINPVIPYAITGAIWYQGEANSKRAYAYRTTFPLLIKDWRQQWRQGDFPFYFCQLANFRPKQSVPGESDWAELREAQLMTLSVPNTGQAVLIDTGEAADIHPQSKQTAGERLASIALARVYGKSIPCASPLYKSMKIEGDKIRLSFTDAEEGLAAKDLPATYIMKTQDGSSAPLVRNSPRSQLEGFAICGEDKKWVWADAKIDGDTVLVWSDQVPAPIAVRYAWADNPTCNLYSKAGIPASPFRTDDFPGITRDPQPPR